MSEVSERDKLRISTQPVIFKCWKLQISHNHPRPDYDNTHVINVYWNYHWLGAKVDRRINLHTGYCFLWIKSKRPYISIPPYKY